MTGKDTLEINCDKRYIVSTVYVYMFVFFLSKEIILFLVFSSGQFTHNNKLLIFFLKMPNDNEFFRAWFYAVHKTDADRSNTVENIRRSLV